MQVVHIGCGHVMRMYDAANPAESVEFVAIVVHALRCAVSPRWGALKVIPAEGTPAGPRILTHFYGLGVYAENVFSPVNAFGYRLPYPLSEIFCQFAAGVELVAAYQGGDSLRAFFFQTVEQQILTVNAKGFHSGRKGYDLQVREFRNRPRTTEVSFLIYEISSKLFGYLKNLRNFVTKLCIAMILVITLFATTKLLKINDMYNFFIITFLKN